MRLIDADALLVKIKNHTNYEYERTRKQAFRQFEDCIRNMPTAYNVDSVVEELEDVGIPHIIGIIEELLTANYEKTMEIVEKGGIV